MAEYKIDDLAQAANTTTRNIRAYRERGLLHEPQRRGRINFYDESHLERLKLIDTLLQRGFTSAHIIDFIEGWESGKSLAEILGLPSAVTTTWSRDETLELPLEGIEAFLGARDRELLDKLIEMGMVSISNDNAVFAETQLVEAFLELRDFGFELRPLIDVMGAVTEHVDQIAQIMIRAGMDLIENQQRGSGAPERTEDVGRTIDAITRLENVAVKSVHILLARAVDHNLKQGLDQYFDGAASSNSRPPAQPSP
ncbi:MerR family transcriptional regulator [Hoyosella altamirensis]|uniref:DNA-binding transcriptional MerR regulator n=1 Tax=Hoyosella altamirensis TaxID=616997 RepID=A0A839RLB7_9ACTN|nr:MerR family transcriptional regulator [Hoyosella altamirensis]MBB3036896.1 DNA-binding transcriptional MerR regulator [Hoyosella altamirensis]